MNPLSSFGTERSLIFDISSVNQTRPTAHFIEWLVTRRIKVDTIPPPSLPRNFLAMEDELLAGRHQKHVYDQPHILCSYTPFPDCPILHVRSLFCLSRRILNLLLRQMASSLDSIPSGDVETKKAILISRRSIILALVGSTPPSIASLDRILINGYLSTAKNWMDDVLVGSVGELTCCSHRSNGAQSDCELHRSDSHSARHFCLAPLFRSSHYRGSRSSSSLAN
jgi:hypothetical protein